jgi:Type IV secretion system pilin
MKNNMKKVFIIMVMVMSVGAGAADPVPTNFNNSGTGSDFNNSGTGSNFNNSGTGSDFNNSGTGSNFNNSGTNIMLGGGDGAQNTGLGNQNSGFGSQLYGSAPDTNVPKVSLAGVVAWLSSIMNQLIYLILTASLVAFLYGIFKLSFVDGLKPEAREQARKFMFWGIVSLFVMVSVWGLVSILKVSLFGNGPLIIPQLK